MENLHIRTLKENEEYKACALWNLSAQSEILHKKLPLEKFIELFISNSENLTKINLVLSDENNENIYGFANGCYKKDSDIAYVTFIIINKEKRRQGYGKSILNKLEESLQAIATKPLKSFDIIFFNPINLEWIIPETIFHDHPNAPGVDMLTEGYIFCKNVGYRDIAYQNSFYRCLNEFKIEKNVDEKIKELNKKGIKFTIYDEKIHFDMNKLFENLNNPNWTEIVMGNLESSKPLPVLIVEDKGKVIGFCGPLYVQESKRGYFAGIGIHSDYRQHGLGKALFCMLCKTLKDMGAEYMTLFTGETNPARNIYEYAGFKIVRSWSDMRKEIK